MRAASDDDGSEGHSHSYFTVAELMAYDWTQTTRKTGIVGCREFARWMLFGSPDAWSGLISGRGIVIHDGTEAASQVRDRAWDIFRGYANTDGAVDQPTDHLPADLRERMQALFGARPIFRVEWTVPYYASARAFLGECMPRLWRLGTPDDVRIVFWFDN